MVGFGLDHSLVCTIQSKSPGGALFRILSVDVETGEAKDWQRYPGTRTVRWSR